MNIEQRIKSIREFTAGLRLENSEYGKFTKYFFQANLSGVLIPPGVELSPFEIGLMIVDRNGQIRIDKKNGIEPCRDDMQRIRTAAVYSIDGTYSLGIINDNFTVGISIDNPDALSYIKENADVVAAFLQYSEGRFKRYPSTQEIQVENDDIICTFPQVTKLPESVRSIHIYTRPVDRSKINHAYARLSFALHPPTPPIE